MGGDRWVESIEETSRVGVGAFPLIPPNGILSEGRLVGSCITGKMMEDEEFDQILRELQYQR